MRETTSTWTWEYDLDGRAVRDMYVGHRTDGTEPYHGGAIRIFNPEKSEWEVSWIDNGSTGTKWFTAISSEDRVVMKKAEDPEWRTVFYDITDTSFEWLTEPSGGRMSCERSEK